MMNGVYDHINMEDEHIKEQEENILKLRNSIRDFFEAKDKVSPDYQSKAQNECLREIALQISNHIH